MQMLRDIDLSHYFRYLFNRFLCDRKVNYFGCLLFCRETDKGTYYLVKWRDLPYDQATWEKEDADIADLQAAIDDYKNLRFAKCWFVWYCVIFFFFYKHLKEQL